MSSEELVNAYLDGGISRRIFIRRLVATGVSLGAAVSYAHLLSPERSHAATAHTARDFYTPAGIDVLLLSKDLDKVVDKGKLRVQVSTDEAATITLTADILEDGQPLVIAEGVVVFSGPGTQIIKLRLNKDGRKALEGREKARITINARAQDQQNSISVDLASKKLK